jgi:hypothetical protein
MKDVSNGFINAKTLTLMLLLLNHGYCEDS